MSLVNELQEIAETADILTVLRKAKRVSGKLDRNDILDWIKNELNGYDGEVPDYRNASHDLWYNTNGPIPAGWNYTKNGTGPLPDFGLNSVKSPVRDSIINLQESLSKENYGGLTYNLPDKTEKMIRKHLSENYQQILLFMFVSKLEIQRIVQSVRDVVLDWAIKLEQEGVIGEGHSFTPEEKIKAASVTINIGEGATIGSVGSNSEGEVILEES